MIRRLAHADHAPFLGQGSHGVLENIRGFISNRHAVAGGTVERFGAIVMTDIVESTQAAGELGDERWAATLIRHDAAVRDDIDRHGGECIKFTGDGYLATFAAGEDALRCVAALRDTAARFGLAICTGVHAGAYQPAGQDALGLTVVIASRLMAANDGPNILVSDAVSKAVAGAGFQFGQPQTLRLKGVSQPVVAAELVIGTEAQSAVHRWLPSGDDAHSRPRRRDRVVLAGARRFPRAAHIFAKNPRQSRTAETVRAPRIRSSN